MITRAEALLERIQPGTILIDSGINWEYRYEVKYFDGEIILMHYLGHFRRWETEMPKGAVYFVYLVSQDHTRVGMRSNSYASIDGVRYLAEVTGE